MSEGPRKEGDTIGDYRLVRPVSEGQLTRTWEGEQISMQRPVMIEILRQQAMLNQAIVRSFLSDVRAKALVTHPGIGSVYEAVTNEEAAFFARERMDGVSLESLHQTGAKFAPLDVVVLLGQLAEALLHLEKEKVATVDYELYHFIISGKEHARMMNLAVEGEPDPQVEVRTKHLLGQAFDGMLQAGLPGATRVKSLCAFMTDSTRQTPITWYQIVDLCRQVKEQLQGPKVVAAPEAAAPSYEAKEPRKIPTSVWALLGGIALIGGLIAVMVSGPEKKTPDTGAPETATSPFVEIPAGQYQLPGGQEISIREPFQISRTEVTLSDYNRFLEDPRHSEFRHSDQPTSKSSHLPDDWAALWPAAVKGESWQGRPMSIRCPVIGVDWWDAYAFAAWSGGRLPDLNEWAAAAEYQGLPSKATSWSPVDQEDGADVTGAGLMAMAGNVREWTGQFEVNPAAPLAPKSCVAAGASFQNPKEGVKGRLWADSRSHRANDLGFRVIVEK